MSGRWQKQFPQGTCILIFIRLKWIESSRACVCACLSCSIQSRFVRPKLAQTVFILDFFNCSSFHIVETLLQRIHEQINKERERECICKRYFKQEVKANSILFLLNWYQYMVVRNMCGNTIVKSETNINLPIYLSAFPFKKTLPTSCCHIISFRCAHTHTHTQ